MTQPTQPKQVWPEDLAQLYRDQGYWRDVTFGQWLDDIAERFSDRLAVVAAGGRLSYRALRHEAQCIAGGFHAAGYTAGTRILIQLPNGFEFLPTVLGALYAGLVPVFALPAHREREVIHLAKTAGVRALICAQSHERHDYTDLALKALEHCPDLRAVYMTGSAGHERAPQLHAFDALRGAALEAPHPSDPSSVAFCQISGGTTGYPKLIPRTHNDYIYSFEASAEICGLTQESVLLTAMPAAHNFPMSSPGYFGVLAKGGCCVMAQSPAPAAAFELIEKEGVTHTGLVPPLALLWMQAAEKNTRDISSLEVLLVGGAKFAPEAAAKVSQVLGCRLQQVFGMAEGLVNYTRLDDPDDVIQNTQGRPISAHDEIKLLHEDGTDAGAGPGILHTRGPYTINAYFNSDDANRKSFTPDGFYCTGDIVVLRPDGNIEVQGRAGDHINRAGEKVSAEEIEDHLLAHEGIFDAAVVSVADKFLGERSCAFVVPHANTDLTAPTLKKFIRTRGIADFKVPDQIIFTAGFDTTAVGKVDRAALRAALKDRHFNAGDPSP